MTYVPRSLLLLPGRKIVGSTTQALYGVIDFDKNMHVGLFEHLHKLARVATNVVKELGESEEPFDDFDGKTYVMPGGYTLSVSAGYCEFIDPYEDFRDSKPSKLILNGDNVLDLLNVCAENRLTGRDVEIDLEEEVPALVDFGQWYQNLFDNSFIKGTALDFWQVLEGQTLRSELNRISISLGGSYPVKRGVPLTWLRPEDQLKVSFEAVAKHHDDDERYETNELELMKFISSVSDAVTSVNG